MAFKKPQRETNRQIILLIEGPENSRKTSIGLSAPGPMGIMDINKGLDIPEFYIAQKEKQITISTIPIPRGRNGTLQQSAEVSADLFLRDVTESLEKNSYTLVDTGTNVWELARLSKMGALTVKDLEADDKKRAQLNFDAPNAFMRDWLFLPYETENNLIITAHLVEKYVGNKPSGIFGARGFKEVPEIVKQHVRVDKDFNCEVLKCRSNQAAIGKVLTCPSFLDLALLFYPESEPEEWYEG